MFCGSTYSQGRASQSADMAGNNWDRQRRAEYKIDRQQLRCGVSCIPPVDSSSRRTSTGCREERLLVKRRELMDTLGKSSRISLALKRTHSPRSVVFAIVLSSSTNGRFKRCESSTVDQVYSSARPPRPPVRNATERSRTFEFRAPLKSG